LRPQGKTAAPVRPLARRNLLRAKPQRYVCPHCKWDFAFRKKKRCPGCGTLLLIASDMRFDTQLSKLKSFWMWIPSKERWNYIRDWEEHKRKAMQRLMEYSKARFGGRAKKDELMGPPLSKWIQ
jgi:hypothetical protein